MTCEICHNFRGNGKLPKKRPERASPNRKFRHRLDKHLLWDTFKASARSCHICDALIKGCRGCFAQNDIQEGDIVDFERRFYYHHWEDEVADIDKTFCFFLKDGTYFDVQIFATAGEDCPIPASWESIPVSRRTSPRTDSSEALQTIKKWLAFCHEDDHDDCEVTENTPLPKRVIDVDGDGDVVLKETQGMLARYICLSHCWGLEPIITTTTETIEERKRRIPLSELSNTFRDAITVTRKLGVRYIWIDSLCIMQNSVADWEMESTKMSSIYTHAYVTLAATHANNGNGGLFKQTVDFEVSGLTPEGEPYRLFLRRVIDHHLDTQDIAARDVSGFQDFGHATITYHPLLTRAWVYQERLLSPRILHFGPYELFMECRSLTQCECDDIGFHGSSEAAPAAQVKLMYAQAIYTTTTSGEEWYVWAEYYLARVWRTLICAYSGLRITKHSDRLPAVGGLAQNLGQVRRVKYVAGLWENTLNDDLLWHVIVPEKQNTPRPRPATAPTWSWASVGAWVSYWDHMYFFNPDEDVTEDERQPYEHFSRIEKWHLDPAGVDEFGQMRRSTITITGLVAEGVLESDVQSDGTIQNIKLPTAQLGFYPDYILGHEGHDQVLPGTKLTCLRMTLLQEGRRDNLISLVLRRIGEQSDVFERIGLLVVSSTPPGDPFGGIFKEQVEQTVTIQ